MIAASKVKGIHVFNTSGDALGSVHELMLEKKSGQLAYAVVSFGGFLGIGQKYHPLPWSELTYSNQFGGFVVDLERILLEDAPVFDASETPDWAAPEFRYRIDAYYATMRAALASIAATCAASNTQ
jgi:hypothetical protein